MLTPDDRLRLLRLARCVLESRVRGIPTPASENDASQIGTASGAFVSIHRQGELRGCLGRLEALPLAEVIGDLARSVADSDPRFEVVGPSELAHIDIEISVLTPEREIASPADVAVGRHGLIVERRGRRGLLLPQVATQHGWDRLTFVEHACLKAGLPRDAWRYGARLFVFEAQVFGERDTTAIRDGSSDGRTW